MSYLNRVAGSSLLCMLLYMFMVSCSNGTVTKTPVTDSTKKAAWTNPRKGKIWDKVNVVQIPLTAYENHILGQVKSVAYKDYKLSENPDSLKVLDDSGYNVYDKAGHLIDQNEYKGDGKPKWKCTYIYDAKNKAIGREFNFFDRNEQEKIAFNYDKNGNERQQVTYAGFRLETKREIKKYDAKGNETEIDRYDTGRLKWIETYKYDDKGYQVEWAMRDTGGRLKRKMACVYDPNGNKIETAIYPSDTGKPFIEKIKNDSLGQEIGRVSYDEDGKVWSKNTIKYDVWGNETENISYDKDGKLNEQWAFYWDNEYDPTGNITKQTEYKIRGGKKVAVSCTETKYTYY